jgi:PEP-CTERM motif
MHKPVTFLPALALGVAGAISAATPSVASPITYTETVTGASGCLGAVMAGVCPGGDSFTNATVTLTMMNDTSHVSGSPPLLFNVETSTPLTLNVTGFPTETFTDTTQAQVNQNTSAVSPNAGFGDNGVGRAILSTMNALFQTYGLNGPIDLSGPAEFNAGVAFPTTDGLFFLNTITGSATFMATPVPTVPEPASLALLLVGFAGLGWIEYRRKS